MYNSKFVQDRRVLSEFSAASSGTGVPANYRDASGSMTTTQGCVWSRSRRECNAQGVLDWVGQAVEERETRGYRDAYCRSSFSPPAPGHCVIFHSCARFLVKNRNTRPQQMARGNGAASPFTSNRMKNTLHSRPGTGGGQGFEGGGNRTAAQTVFPPKANAARPGNASYVAQSNGTKRQKTAHQADQLSKFFPGGQPGEWLWLALWRTCVGAVGVCPDRLSACIDFGSVNAKGKGRAQPVSEPETVTVSSDEDIGELAKRETQSRTRPVRRVNGDGDGDGDGESSDDPLNVIDQSSDCQVLPKQQQHDFDKPSTNNPSRLPSDGPSTLRLQQRHKQRGASVPDPTSVIDVDSPSSDIEVSDTEAGGPQVRRFQTPTGRSEIRSGTVKDRVKVLEQQRGTGRQVLKRGVLDMQPAAAPAPPYLEFKEKKSRAKTMQRRDAKIQARNTMGQVRRLPRLCVVPLTEHIVRFIASVHGGAELRSEPQSVRSKTAP